MIVLASESRVRKQLLTAAGIKFKASPHRTDERILQIKHFAEGGVVAGLAEVLAIEKAKAMRKNAAFLRLKRCGEIVTVIRLD